MSASGVEDSRSIHDHARRIDSASTGAVAGVPAVGVSAIGISASMRLKRVSAIGAASGSASSLHPSAGACASGAACASGSPIRFDAVASSMGGVAGDAKVCNETGGSSARVSWRQADSSPRRSPASGAAWAGGSVETHSAAAGVTVSMDSGASTVAASIVTGSTTAGSGAGAGAASKAAVCSGALVGATARLRSLADRKMSSNARPAYS